ncbi:hypothetical protein HDU97_003950 [Phlyctochytrium planicorne]|nr:hypothetical protein HDU97_003950 [Phlyctochytrium planicorne]
MFLARGGLEVAKGTANVLRTLATPILGPPKVSEEDKNNLGKSVLSLNTSDGKVDYLAIADYISFSVNTGLSVAANTVLGYNLEFKVHEHGAILVTGAGGKVGAHAVRTFCALGYTVFAGVKSQEEGRRLQNRCVRDMSKGVCVPIVLDVTSPESLRDAYESICEHLGVDPEDPSKRIPSTPSHTPSNSLDTLVEDVVSPSTPSRAYGKAPLSPLSPTHSSATKMPRGHSRLAMAVTNASDFSEDEELDLPERPFSPSKVAAASNDGGILVGLVNCEGTESPGPLELLPLAELMRCYEVNTAGAVAVTQCFLPLLRESKGRIVNVCSSAGLTAAPINGSYAASKMALQAVSDSLRVELYPFGISVSIIEPGSLDANAWSPNQVMGGKLLNDKNHSYQLHQQRPDTPSAGPSNSTPIPPSHTPPEITPSPSRRASNAQDGPVIARFQAVSPSAFPVGGLSLHPHPSGAGIGGGARSVSPSERRNPPPRSWSSLSSYDRSGQVEREDPPLSPSSPRFFAHTGRSASPSFIPVPSRIAQQQQQQQGGGAARVRRGSAGVLPAYQRAMMSPTPASGIPVRGGTTSPPPQRRSLTPQPSARPNQMYQPPSPPRQDGERGRSMSRIYRQHPVWDVRDRMEVSERLYGPLIETVRELSEVAAAANVGPSSSEDKGKGEGSLVSSPGGSARSSTGKLNETTPLLVSTDKRSGSVAAISTASPASAGTSSVSMAAQSSSRHTSRAILHALTSPYPKTRYRVGWDARATAALRWALPDRVLDWGFSALSAANARESQQG